MESPGVTTAALGPRESRVGRVGLGCKKVLKCRCEKAAHFISRSPAAQCLKPSWEGRMPGRTSRALGCASACAPLFSYRGLAHSLRDPDLQMVGHRALSQGLLYVRRAPEPR